MRYLLLFLLLFSVSCSSYRASFVPDWTFSPVTGSVQKEDYEIFLVPAACSYSGCKAFTLRMYNNSGYDITIDWDNTLYIDNGFTNGGFLFEGIPYTSRKGEKPDDVVFAGQYFSKLIYPGASIYYYDGWVIDEMPAGDHGIYLVMDDGYQEIKEKIVINIHPDTK